MSALYVAFILVQACEPNKPCMPPIELMAFRSAYDSGEMYCRGVANYLQSTSQPEEGKLIYTCVDPVMYEKLMSKPAPKPKGLKL